MPPTVEQERLHWRVLYSLVLLPPPQRPLLLSLVSMPLSLPRLLLLLLLLPLMLLLLVVVQQLLETAGPSQVRHRVRFEQRWVPLEKTRQRQQQGQSVLLQVEQTRSHGW